MTEKTDGARKIMAMHQPNYLPYAGYFYKMGRCDLFVLLDAVQFPRGQSFANRNRVKTHNGTTWLTVPVSIPSGEKGKVPYTEVAFGGDKWRRKHLRTLQMNYKKAPYYEEVYALVERVLEEAEDFTEMNISLIEAVAEYLEIDTPTARLSELGDDFGEKTELIVDICREVGAGAYLSGTGGGKEYNDEQLLASHGIELRYSDFEHPEYPQLWDGFESHLSVIDMLFNCGPESRELLFG